MSMPRSARGAARRGERGLIFVLFAIFCVVVLGLIGLAVDATHIQSAGVQLQNAADASALAAARAIHLEAVAGGSGGTFVVTRKAAVDCAALNTAAEATVLLNANLGNISTGDIVVGVWTPATRTFTPSLVSPNAVKVTARLSHGAAAGPLALTFGGMFGAPTSDVERTSIACAAAEADILIHVLDPSRRGALKMSGNARLDVGTGRVQVDSSSSCAIDVNGDPVLTAAKTVVHGYSCAPDGAIQGELEEQGPVEPDPLADILPTTSAWNAVKSALAQPLGATGKISATGSFEPGYYPKGLSINSSTAVTLKPGTYLFGTDVSLGAQSLVTGSGVTLLLDQGVKLSVGGGASLVLSPQASGPYEGLTLMFHRKTTGLSTCSIGGGGAISFEGSLYCPAGGVDLGGNGEAQAFGQIVCNTLSCSGTPEITGVDIVPPEDAGPVSLVE